MEFVFEGVVFSVLPEQKGTSARGEWHSQNVVFEMQNNSPYSRKVSVSFSTSTTMWHASLLVLHTR